MARILIVEDEARIASFVAKGLTADGHTTSTAADGVTGLDLALSGEFDLMILDIGLPGLDGYAVLDGLRAQGSELPVIVLTARDSVDDTVVALDGGADDYMAKPFRFAELLARVRVRLRASAPREASRDRETRLTVGAVSLDLLARTAARGGRTVELSAREYQMLELFMRNAGNVLSREQLLSHVWGYDYDPGSNVVDVYVGYLRKKLGSDVVATARGMGYRMPRALP